MWRGLRVGVSGESNRYRSSHVPGVFVFDLVTIPLSECRTGRVHFENSGGLE